MSEASVLSESKSAEAANAAAVAAEAIEQAREAQMEAVFERAFKKAFTLDDGIQRRFIDISRANLICQSIVGIHGRVESIEDNLKWGIRVVIGAVILGVLALLFTK